MTYLVASLSPLFINRVRSAAPLSDGFCDEKQDQLGDLSLSAAVLTGEVELERSQLQNSAKTRHDGENHKFYHAGCEVSGMSTIFRTCPHTVSVCSLSSLVAMADHPGDLPRQDRIGCDERGW